STISCAIRVWARRRSSASRTCACREKEWPPEGAASFVRRLSWPPGRAPPPAMGAVMRCHPPCGPHGIPFTVRERLPAGGALAAHPATRGRHGDAAREAPDVGEAHAPVHRGAHGRRQERGRIGTEVVAGGGGGAGDTVAEPAAHRPLRGTHPR